MKDGRLLFMWGDRIRHIIDDDGIQAYCGKCGFIVSKYLQIANKKEDAKPQ